LKPENPSQNWGGAEGTHEKCELMPKMQGMKIRRLELLDKCGPDCPEDDATETSLRIFRWRKVSVYLFGMVPE